MVWRVGVGTGKQMEGGRLGDDGFQLRSKPVVLLASVTWCEARNGSAASRGITLA